MIKGIGTDLIELDRIEKAITNNRFVERVLTSEEYQVYQKLNQRRKVEFMAGRFAAKEAFSKARGTGIGKELSWQDISILNDPTGKPIIKAPKKEQETFHLSLSHTQTMATAFVIIESLLMESSS